MGTEKGNMTKLIQFTEHEHLARTGFGGVDVRFTTGARDAIGSSPLYTALNALSTQPILGGAMRVCALAVALDVQQESIPGGGTFVRDPGRTVALLAHWRTHEWNPQRICEITFSIPTEAAKAEWSQPMPPTAEEAEAKRLRDEREAIETAARREAERIEGNRQREIAKVLGGDLEIDRMDTATMYRALHALAAHLVETKKQTGALGADYEVTK